MYETVKFLEKAYDKLYNILSWLSMSFKGFYAIRPHKTNQPRNILKMIEMFKKKIRMRLNFF